MVRVSAVLLVLLIQNAAGNRTDCPGAAADIAFLMDGSGSVSPGDFISMKTFIKHMIRSLLGLGQVTQFSVAQYGDSPTVHHYFDNFATSGSWESQIDRIKQIGGGTSTARAIRHVVQDVFVRVNSGSRPNVNRFLIVITDGSSSDRNDLSNAAALAAREGIIRFAIGVGSAFDSANTRAELNTIATDPSKHVFRVTSYGALDEILETLSNNICPVTTAPAAPTTPSTPSTTTRHDEDPQLICGQSQIQIGLNLFNLQSSGLNGSSGHLADPQCSSFTERDGKVWYQVERQDDTCGNTLTTNTTHAIYSNSLFIYSANGVSIPADFPFSCVYPLDTETSLDVAIRPDLDLDGGMIGVGSPTSVSTSLFQNSNYTEPYPAGPVTLPVGSALYVGVSVGETDPRFVVVLDDCYATHSSNPDELMRHFLIQNKCSTNRRQVTVVESGSSLQARFSALLFLFHGEYRDMYLHCSLHLCDQSASSCSPVCSGRRRRSVSTSAAFKTITIGPIAWDKVVE